MSQKNSKKLRKTKKVQLKMLAFALASGMIPVPTYSNGEVLLSVYPHYTQTLTAGNDHDIKYGLGVGSKLTWRPLPFLDFSVSGDYLSLALPNVDSINVVDGQVGAGYHVQLSDRAAINLSCDVGAYKALQDNSMTGLSAGATLSFSYKINPVVSTEAHASMRHLAAGNAALLTGASVGPGVTFNLTNAVKTTTNVLVEEGDLKPVFPVFYSWYQNNPFGKIRISNNENSKIQNVKVSFYQPQYMGHPNICAEIKEMEKGEQQEVELTAFFNERMLELTEKTDTQAIISVEYSYLGRRQKYNYSMIVPVYGRNSMSWDDDRSASVFVSSKDPAAMWFAKYVASIVSDKTRNGVPKNIQYAMAIFETLDQFGLNYVIDPSSAYADNVGTSSIDFLQFPYQTLMYRGGDCDDISILTCSLFEAVGVPTAFITIPGHIFMAFDSGLTDVEAYKQFNSLSNYIILNHEVWVPLEITLTDEGFNKAWRVGAREWNLAERNGTAALYKTHDSWKIYKPVSVSSAGVNFTMPERQVVGKLFDHCVDEWVLREINPQIDMYKTILAKENTFENQNSLGVLYGKYGLFTQADDQFKKGRRAGYIPSILNTANLYFSMQDYELARKWYKEVLKKDNNNVLAHLGVARCDYELENYDECDEAYNKVRALNYKLSLEYAYLGAFENVRGRSFNLSDRLKFTVWSDDAGEKRNREMDELKKFGTTVDSDVDAPVQLPETFAGMEALVPDSEISYKSEDAEEDINAKATGDGKDPDNDLKDASELGFDTEAILEEDEIALDYKGLSNQVARLVPDLDVSSTFSMDSLLVPDQDFASESVDAPAVEEVVAEVEAAAPAVEEVVAEVEAAAPAVEEVVAEVDAATPAVEEVVAEVEAAAPAVEEVIAEVEAAAPAVEEVLAEVEVTAPAVEEVVTEVEAVAPAVEEAVAEVEVTALAVEEVVAEVEAAAPAVETTVAEIDAVEAAPLTDSFVENVAPDSHLFVSEPVVETAVTEASPVVEKLAPVSVSELLESIAAMPVAESVSESKDSVDTEIEEDFELPDFEEISFEPVVAESAPVEPTPALDEPTFIVAEEMVVEPTNGTVENAFVEPAFGTVETIVATDEAAVAEPATVIAETTFTTGETALAETVNIVAEPANGTAEPTFAAAEPAPALAETVPAPYIPQDVQFFDQAGFDETVKSFEEIALEVQEETAEEIEDTQSYEYSEKEEYAAAEEVENTEIAQEFEEAVYEETSETEIAYEEDDDFDIDSMDFSVAPRFSETPSSEWAPEEAYTATTIPGMKSYDTEMGNYQNEKAFLFEEKAVLATDPENDVDITLEVKVEEQLAMVEPEVNPFSSFLSAEDAKIVEQITNYTIPETSAQKEIDAETVEADNVVAEESDNQNAEIKEIDPKDVAKKAGLFAVCSAILAGGVLALSKSNFSKNHKEGK